MDPLILKLSRLSKPDRDAFLKTLKNHEREALLSVLRSSTAAGYLTDPVGFIRRFLPAFEITDYQADILDAIAGGGRVAARGPRGLGKTALAAVFIIFFCITRNSAGINHKLVCTSGSHFQLRAYLWPEVHRWVRELKWDELGIAPWRPDEELLKTGIQLDYGLATSASPERPELIEGAHATHVAVIYDESKSIGEDLFHAIEGVFSNLGPDSDERGYAMAVSTPGAPAGAFYDIHAKKAGTEDWATVKVSLDAAIAAGRVNRAWADRLEKLWGPESSLFHNHVLGEFRAADESGVIPVEWVLAAFERHKALGDRYSPAPQMALGVDVARAGRDRTVVAVGRGDDYVHEFIRLPRQDTTTTSTDVGRIASAFPGCRITVDADGIGVGVADNLIAKGHNAHFFHGGPPLADWTDATGELQANSRRTAAWWHLRQLLDPRLDAKLALPEDDELLGDLTGPRLLPDLRGKLKLEPKEATKKRIGRSPDVGDALVYLCWDEPVDVAQEWVPDQGFTDRAAQLVWTRP